MKNMLSLVLVLGLGIVLLPGCGSAKKGCCASKCSSKEVTCEKRVSGPLSDKEVGWTAEDLK